MREPQCESVKRFSPVIIDKAEVDVFLITADSKNRPLSQGRGDSVGVIERGERTKVVHVYLRGLASSATVR